MKHEFNRNEDWMKLAVSQMRSRFEQVCQGGGKKALARQAERNKLTARERITYLCDSDQPFHEIGAFAGYDMYEAEGGCPAGGTVAGIGYISGRQCVVVANDQTVKAGAWFPITGKKNLRLQEIAMENRLPIIYLVDSAGVFLPMQDEIFPDKEHFGRIFRNNARMSAMGITQIAAVMGACVAGGAYLPIMSDETLMVEGNGSIFLAGPYLVKAAIGEEVDAETLGGAETHNAISGIADYKFSNEQECLDHIKKMDVTGFMVGSRSEHSGIIKDGAKLVNAVANSVVPKITIIVGNSYGAGNYAMCGKAYDPRFIYAWPSARIAVMGGEQAAKTLLQIQVAAMKQQGKEISSEEEQQLLQTIKDRYESQTSPYYAAARLWVDDIIDPIQTRELISAGIHAANQNAVIDEFKTGVFQV
eukprot:jgi/Mesen1/318/ME1156409C09520